LAVFIIVSVTHGHTKTSKLVRSSHHKSPVLISRILYQTVTRILFQAGWFCSNR